MADTGFILPGSGTSVLDGGRGDWMETARITNGSDDYAHMGNFGEGYTAKLLASSFSFSIPEGVEIVGVEVQIRKRSGSGTGMQDREVRLYMGGSAIGDNKKNPAAWPNAFQTFTYGGATDLWGVELTRAQVVDPGFGVYITGDWVGKAIPNVPFIKMNIYYEADSGNTFERVSGVYRKGKLSERVSGVYRPGKLHERVGGIWRS